MNTAATLPHRLRYSPEMTEKKTAAEEKDEKPNLGTFELKLPFLTYKVTPKKAWAIVLLSLIGLGAIGYLVWWLWPKPEPPTPPPEMYAVRVVVLDPDDQPVKDSEIHSSVGNEPQEVDGGWEIEIPRSKVPDDGKVTFRAVDPASSGRGSTTLTLGDAPTPLAEIRLEIPEATVRGTVLDPQNRALAGAKVSVSGFGDEAITTDDSGTFELVAHRPPGQRVRIRVEHPDYTFDDKYCQAGTTNCMLRPT